MRITPSRAIKIECKFCNGGMGSCKSKYCALNRSGKPIDRIADHCRECAPNNRIEECIGFLIGTQAKMIAAFTGQALMEDGKAQCPLYPFRYGKNPNLGRSLSEDQKKKAIANLRPFRKTKNAVDKVPD
jgi:hypothetical protein